MIKIGKIKKIFKKPKLLLFTYVDDNSPLKSTFFWSFKTFENKEKISFGKGYDKKTDSYLRVTTYKWSLYSYFKNKSFIWIGYGCFEQGNLI